MVATVLTVYGIETYLPTVNSNRPQLVATVLTVYGIETNSNVTSQVRREGCNSTYRLRY